MSPVRVRSPALWTSAPPCKLSHVKTEERAKARELRRDAGLSMKEIARALDVSLSSVSLWVRDIELDEMQGASLRVRAARRRGQATAARWRRFRAAAQEEGRDQARRGNELHL